MIKEGDIGVHHSLQGGQYVADLVVHLLETAGHAAAADLAIAEGLDGQVSRRPSRRCGRALHTARHQLLGVPCKESERVLSRADGWQWSDRRGAGGGTRRGCGRIRLGRCLRAG